jgi:hypothetical protein
MAQRYAVTNYGREATWFGCRAPAEDVATDRHVVLYQPLDKPGIPTLLTDSSTRTMCRLRCFHTDSHVPMAWDRGMLGSLGWLGGLSCRPGPLRQVKLNQGRARCLQFFLFYPKPRLDNSFSTSFCFPRSFPFIYLTWAVKFEAALEQWRRRRRRRRIRSLTRSIRLPPQCLPMAQCLRLMAQCLLLRTQCRLVT